AGEVRASHRFDEKRLEDWLKAELPEAGGGLEVEQFSYGQSNPTFLLRLNNAEYVLRSSRRASCCRRRTRSTASTACRRPSPAPAFRSRRRSSTARTGT